LGSKLLTREILLVEILDYFSPTRRDKCRHCMLLYC